MFNIERKKIIFSVFFLLFIGFSLVFVMKLTYFSKLLNPSKKTVNNDKLVSDKKVEKPTFKPSISIVLVDLGLNEKEFKDALQLPNFISFGFSPYSSLIEKFVEKAREDGHDTLINIPTETLNYFFEDSGPYALLGNLDNSTENAKRLEFIFSKSQNMDTYYTSIGDAYTDDVEDLTFLLNKIKGKKVNLLYNDAKNIKPVFQVAENLNILSQIAQVTMILDSSTDKLLIREGLAQLKYYAVARGIAIGFIRPYPISIETLNEWLQSMNDADVQIVPISRIFDILKIMHKE